MSNEPMNQLPNEPIDQLPDDLTTERPNNQTTQLSKSPVRRMGFVLLMFAELVALCGVLAFSIASPAVATFLGSWCDAGQTCTTTCNGQTCNQVSTTIHHNGHEVTVPGHWQRNHVCYDNGDGTKTCFYNTVWVPGYTYNVPSWDEKVTQTVCTPNCTESCTDTGPTSWPKCNGTCPSTQHLVCNGTCGAGANCVCLDNSTNTITTSQCNSAANCGGTTNCPHSQTGGAHWSCQDHQCISICGTGNNNNNNNNNNNGNPTSTPGIGTATPQATNTPFPIPTPYIPPHCPPHPEDLGGSVTSIIPPGAPIVQFANAPTYPVVVGQDATQRGADLSAQISVGACTINWHYRVKEDYVYCGPNKPVCNCSVDSCELRTRWKQWDESCSENYPLAGVTIDGKLSQDSVNYITGPLQQQYPGVKVYQGSIRFFPSANAQQTEYTVGNPTIWAMAGVKYPLEDPGGWDVTVNIATQPTIHCGPLRWSLPFPKELTTYFRDQTLTK